MKDTVESAIVMRKIKDKEAIKGKHFGEDEVSERTRVFCHLPQVYTTMMLFLLLRDLLG